MISWRNSCSICVCSTFGRSSDQGLVRSGPCLTEPQSQEAMRYPARCREEKVPCVSWLPGASRNCHNPTRKRPTILTLGGREEQGIIRSFRPSTIRREASKQQATLGALAVTHKSGWRGCQLTEEEQLPNNVCRAQGDERGTSQDPHGPTGPFRYGS